MYAPSRHILDCYIAGFTYWDGAEVIAELSLGDKIDIRSEPDCPHDPNAVSLYYKDTKLGYIPQANNQLISTFLYYGYDIFESKVSQINQEAHPSRQMRITIKIKETGESGNGR